MENRINEEMRLSQLHEVTQLRNRYSKHFDLDGKRRQAVVYPHAVHFKAGDQWEEIDNTLIEADREGKPVWRTKANEMMAEFARSSASDSLVRLSHDDHVLEWNLESKAQDQLPDVGTGKIRNGLAEDESLLPACSISEVVYEEILPGMDVRYRMEGMRCKEEIVLKNREAAKAWAIRVKGQGWAFKQLENGQIEVCESDGSEKTDAVFRFAAPFVVDAEGKGQDATVQVVMTDMEDGVVLEYLPDEAFLDSAVYPVVIDPTVDVPNSDTNLDDTYVCQNHPTTNYNSKSYMECGWQDSNHNDNISLLRFNQLAGITAGDTIVKARLRLGVVQSSDYAKNPKYVGLYAMTKDWNVSSITWNSFTTLNGMSAEVQDCIIRTDRTYVYFDITNLCRTWYTKVNNVSQNFGFALHRPVLPGNTVWYYTQFYSSRASKAPLLTITYVSHVGDESRWNYQSMSAGRAGSLSAELFNGNSVATHADIAMAGLRRPISVSHTYNSCECESNDYYCGYGWRTSFHQFVEKVSLDSDEYYVWVDGDGTRHFFKITGNSSPYSDEDGLHLKLTVNSSTNTITIKDLMDDSMIFKKENSNWTRYWLTQITDLLDNKIDVTWLAEGKINRLTDSVRRYVLYSYDSNGLLLQLKAYMENGTDAGYPYCQYFYTNGNLTGIGYSDLTAAGAQMSSNTTYTYSGHLLTKLHNYDNVEVSAEYKPLTEYNSPAFAGTLGQQMQRIVKMERTGVDQATNSLVKGGLLEFEYGLMCTHVNIVTGSEPNAANDHRLIYQFNDRGNIVSVRDDAGYASYKNYDAEYPNYPDVISRLQRTSVNLLVNHNFETTSGWTTALTGGAAGTHSFSSDQRKEGTKAAKMERSNAAGVMSISQTVNVTQNKTYTLSCWARTNAAAVNVQAAAVSGGQTTEGLKQTSVDEWTRISVTFKANGSTATVMLKALDGAGSAWFDCAQMEPGEVANRYNMLENGTFAQMNGTAPVNWTPRSENDASTDKVVDSLGDMHPAYLGDHALNIDGYPNATKGFQQEIIARGSYGDRFTVGGWAKGKSRPIDGENNRFCMRLEFYNNGTWTDGGHVDWNEEWEDWQYASGGIKAPASYTKIRFGIDYERNVNSCLFDGVALYREAFGEECAYNSKGLLAHVTTLSGQRDTRLYDTNDNFAQYEAPGADGHDTYMHYGFSDDAKKKHLLRYSNTPMYVQDVYAYDSYGNMTAHKRQDTSPTVAIRETNSYDAQGERLMTQTDARGNATNYTYNTNNTVQSVTAPNGQTVNYTYDSANRVTAVTAVAGSKTYRNGYEYQDDRLTEVSHNTTSNTTNDVKYSFEYNALGLPTVTKVGSQTLCTNVYGPTREHKLEKVQYGNGQVVRNGYDQYGRLIGVAYNNATDTNWRYEYAYGANGQASKVQDNNLHRVMWTEFDEANRPQTTTCRDTSTGALITRYRLSYNEQENVSQVKENVAGTEYATTYTYDWDNRPTELRYGSTSQRVRYTYDGPGRLATRRVTNGSADQTTTYSYLNSPIPIPGLSTLSSTNLVSSISQPNVSFSYEYEANTANIRKETRTKGGVNEDTFYTYDTLGQLIRVNDQKDTTAGSSGTTWTYEYDCGGNIINKKRYAYTTGSLGSVLQTISYSYGDSNWKDKLTAYNGTTLTYDAIGNLAGDGTWSYTWQAGRQLKQMSKSGTTVVFDYDMGGMRASKTVGSTKTSYIYSGTNLTHMTKGATVMHFFYDGQGRPAIVKYNSVYYSYLYDLQGDVIGIVDSTGALVVEYKYDAWGKPLGKTGSLASTLGTLNPFRYRGYVYDEETGLYYLQSRYYNPTWGRFVNADVLLGQVGALLGHNVFAYCCNNPVNREDASGHFSSSFKGQQTMRAYDRSKRFIPIAVPSCYLQWCEEAEITKVSVEVSNTGEELQWIVDTIDVITAEGVTDLVSYVLMANGMLIADGILELGSDILTIINYYLSDYANSMNHESYEYSVYVDAKYPGDITAQFVYTFTLCNEENCAHYEGVTVYGTARAWGWFPVKSYNFTYGKP